MDSENMRLPEDSESWNEFDWESFLRKNDDVVNEYFNLLYRFRDFPDVDKLIEDHLKKIIRKKEDLDNFDSFFSDENRIDPFDEDLDEEAIFFEEDFMYETHPLYMILMRVSLGWSNIYSSVLPPHERNNGVSVMFYCGKALSLTVQILDIDNQSDSPIKIALSKRLLNNINRMLEILNKLSEENDYILELLTGITSPLRKAHDLAVDLLYSCRKEEDMPF
ncbi:MAG: hypothetical protein U9O87_00660 [Verrucomicrobiota bacterium]|nr:hypothetical protein [Verrucomicrobiota bacterium]